MSPTRFATRTLLLLLFCALLISTSNAYALSKDYKVCVGLAADPDDPLGPEGVKGVWLERIFLKGALPACRKAVEADPENNTLRYLLARVLHFKALNDDKPDNAEVRKLVNALIDAEYWTAGMMMLSFVDEKHAHRIISKAAEQGHRVANLLQGRVLIRQKKPKEAIPFLQKAANAGVAQAHTAIFVAVNDMFGSDFDQGKALDFLRTGMRLGDPLAGEYIDQIGTQDDQYEHTSIRSRISVNNGNDKGVAISARINTQRRDAELGYADEILELGKNLITRGTPKDRKEAEYWLKSVQSTKPSALFQLFRLYITEEPVRTKGAAHILAKMRNATEKTTGDAYFSKETIKKLTTRVLYERLSNRAHGTLDDIRALVSRDNGEWYDSAIEKMLYKVKAKSLQSNAHRVYLRLSIPSDPESSIHFEFEDIEGAEDKSCIYQSFNELNLDYSLKFTHRNKNRYNKIRGSIESSCAAIFPTRIKVTCETALICGRGDKEDYGRCGRHRSTEYITLPALKYSKSFSTSIDLDTSVRYGTLSRTNCQLMAVDDKKYYGEFRRPAYP